MGQARNGTIVDWHTLAPGLAIFRVMPEPGARFPSYKAGQYTALRRENCNLTKKLGVHPDGRPIFGPDLDDNGLQKKGPVTHHYSIASAPYETETQGFLEFYLIRERIVGYPGRLTEALFSLDLERDNHVIYLDEINGEFTLKARAAGFRHVLFVGTGTGLAPFASMIKQLHFEAQKHAANEVSYTLLHTNRTFDELGYHSRMQEIEASGRFDFLYIPSVSRPTSRDREDATLGMGRANNLLRHILDMPLREEEDLQEAARRGDDISEARRNLDEAVRPVLPRRLNRNRIRERIGSGTVILSCGNARAMEDIKRIALKNQIRFEKEDW